MERVAVIDLHCHLLPVVDDGPPTLAESIAMARLAYDDGVRSVAVTPHSGGWLERYRGPEVAETMRSQVRALEEALHQAGIALTLYPGMEVDFDPDLPQQLLAGQVQPLGNGPYFLMELPAFQYSLHLEQTLFQVQLQGWRPVLAHVERYLYVQENPDLLAPLVQRGVVVQITARNLAGAAGPETREIARKLLRRGLVHVLASDGHRARGARLPLLAAGVTEAARIVGADRARAMVTTVPQRILEGKEIGEL